MILRAVKDHLTSNKPDMTIDRDRDCTRDRSVADTYFVLLEHSRWIDCCSRSLCRRPPCQPRAPLIAVADVHVPWAGAGGRRRHEIELGILTGQTHDHVAADRRKGHPGACRRVPDHVDEHAEVPLAGCPCCGGPLAAVEAVEQFVETCRGGPTSRGS